MNSKVDLYINNAKIWQEEMEALRAILLDCGLTEELKWGKPCYAFEGKNIVVIQGFKKYCAILFFKGNLLKDPDKVLIKTGENTRVGRQIRIQDVDEILQKADIIIKYIRQAIEVERSGLKEDKEKTIPEYPDELKIKFKELPAFKKAFDALTPGRQRAWLIHFSSAKQSSTRESRIEKSMQLIFKGKSLNDY